MKERDLPARLRGKETASSILETFMIGLSHNAVLVTLIERGRISEGEVIEIMTTQGSTFYQNRNIRKFSRQLGLSEEERQGVMAVAFINAMKFLTSTSLGDQTNG